MAASNHTGWIVERLESPKGWVVCSHLHHDKQAAIYIMHALQRMHPESEYRVYGATK